MNMNRKTQKNLPLPWSSEELKAAAPDPDLVRELRTAVHEAVKEEREALSQCESFLKLLSPAQPSFALIRRLRLAMDGTASPVHGWMRGLFRTRWIGACAAAVALLLVVGAAVKFLFPVAKAPDPQMGRRIIALEEGKVKWNREQGAPYSLDRLLYQDKFVMNDDEGGCVVVSVPNRCQVPVLEEVI